MTNKKFLVGILAMVLVFGMAVVGCDNNGDNGNNNNNNNQQPTLQQAITWANGRTITDAQGGSINLVAAGYQRAVTDALTQAWNTTYQNNPSAWTQDKWRQIIHDTIIDDFGQSYRPITITMGKQFVALV